MNESGLVDSARRTAARDAVRGHLAALAVEVDATRRSAGFTAVLDAIASFWRYSPVNVWLIRRQCPEATLVAGTKVWAELGRAPKPSAAPIGILAFAPGRKPPFVGVSVFDVSQTRGRALPKLKWVLEGDTKLFKLLERAAERLKIPVGVLPANAPVLGLSDGGKIRIRAKLSARQRAATLAHELAHEILHTGAWAKRKRPLPNDAKEIEADATAYVVLKALGLPSAAPTYIAWHGGTGGTIAASMGRIQRAARRILEAAGVDVLSAGAGGGG